ncbi:DUF4238 domain-containing protein [Blastopirellula marina]|uniref:DUF4238 domain-containing protein n=1 Tax=Blastopirellula marina TaxID=124 RepID=A0A2S8F7J4_9BACT|nr:DUF4238 domain-containing protein [Blastopirellula marina]PQO28132.1 hypothetical protein C5Y98_24825 [Blastopirellula marina]PTL41672.1 DUF4238 domain-containing protein [Blastopirellula marina]
MRILAGPKNHHFVPQYYFRLFTGGQRHICAYLTQHKCVIPRAPIKGQCARHKFYGSAEIENHFSLLEGLHASALQTLVKAAENDNIHEFTWEHFPWLLQAIVFQRARTMLEVEKTFPVLEGMMLKMFKEHLLHTLSPEDIEEYVGPIERGEVRIFEDPTATVLRQISVALESASLLVDLQPRLIRNHSDYPFVFSDSPVVFYNLYYQYITDRGVLGLQTPGLMIFYPLTPRLQLLMIDPAVYTGSIANGPFCDIVDRSDVSHLNALQMHHSNSAIYFAHMGDAEYVEELYKAHAPQITKPQAEFRVCQNLLVNGEPFDEEIMHTFEPQLNHMLSLSFLDCKPVMPEEFSFRHRSPEIVEEHDRLHPPGLEVDE